MYNTILATSEFQVFSNTDIKVFFYVTTSSFFFAPTPSYGNNSVAGVVLFHFCRTELQGCCLLGWVYPVILSFSVLFSLPWDHFLTVKVHFDLICPRSVCTSPITLNGCLFCSSSL